MAEDGEGEEREEVEARSRRLFGRLCLPTPQDYATQREHGRDEG
jgi:hypothetical protein